MPKLDKSVPLQLSLDHHESIEVILALRFRARFLLQQCHHGPTDAQRAIARRRLDVMLSVFGKLPANLVHKIAGNVYDATLGA